MSRVVIISLLANDNAPEKEFEAELRKRLESKSFSVDHIAILADARTVEVAKLAK